MLALRAARALRGARRFSDASGGLQLSFAAPHTVYYFETSVASVTLPGASGEYGVTAGHSPLAEQLRPGVVAITHKTGEEPEKFFVSGGFAFTDAEKTEVSALEAVKLEDIDEAKVPKITGQPGRISWVNAMPAIASARIWVTVPVTVTGDMAPERINGETTVA